MKGLEVLYFARVLNFSTLQALGCCTVTEWKFWN